MLEQQDVAAGAFIDFLGLEYVSVHTHTQKIGLKLRALGGIGGYVH